MNSGRIGRILENPRRAVIAQAEIDAVLAATSCWLEKSVIGLGLCPFAAPVVRAGRLRLRVSEGRSAGQVLKDLCRELMWLADQDAAVCETTLLIHPWALGDFLEFNEFLADCERAVASLGLEGVLQVASFHPQYQFAGTSPDDVTNCTNRSPYPTLHVLRESSIAQAVDGLADPGKIYRDNIHTLEVLGPDGWAALWGH